jgi:Putative Ig domain/Right handed beta helix region
MKQLPAVFLLATSALFGQCFNMAGTNGLGYSTPRAIDRDGDGYGIGPTALVHTTVAGAISAGLQTVTPASMSNISVGTDLRIEPGPNQECLVVTATTGTTLTATFSHSHPAGVTVLDLGIIGPDADDSDSTVHTGPQGVSRYGTLSAFINHLEGYTPSHVWYLAPPSPTAGCLANGGTIAQCTGSDSNSCEDNINAPCLTGAHIQGSVTAGMAVVFRDGWNGRYSSGSGTSGNPIILMGYPGELPVIDQTALASALIVTTGQSYLIVDTFQTQNGSCMGGGDNTYVDNPHTFHDNIFKHIVGTNCVQGFGPTVGIQNDTLEDSIFHDNLGVGEQAGIYWGSGCVPSSGATIRRVISYNNGYAGIHLNGWVNGATVSQNLVYDNLVEGIALESGVNTSTVSSNLVFGNNGAEFEIYSYQNGLGMANNCDASYYPVTNATWSGGIATVTIGANSIIMGQYAYINGFNPPGFNCTGTGANTGTGCPLTGVTATTISYAVASNPGAYVSGGYVTGDVGDQAHNLIENNTFYHGNLDFQGNPVGNTSAIWISSHNNATGLPVVGDLGHNTFRNNIAVIYGDINSAYRYAPIAFDNTNGPSFLATSVFDHNLTFQSNGIDSTTAAYGLYQTCAPTCNGQAVYDYTGTALNGGPPLSSIASGYTITGGADGDPRFVAASPAYYANFGKYDFRISSNSLALRAGTTTGTPNYDLAGRVYTDGTPSLGALERNLYAAGWTLLSGAKLMNSTDGGGNANCPADGANSSTGWQSTASAPVPFNASCHTVIDAWGGGWLRDSPGKAPRMCIFGGGHSDGGDDSVYCVNVAATSPALTRILGPQTYGGGSLNDWNTCPAGLPDSAPTTAPNARHSGSSMAYMASLDKVLLQHGAIACGNSRNAYDTWTFDHSAVAWAANNPVDCTDHGFGACSSSSPYIVANTPLDPLNHFPITCAGWNDNVVWDPVTQTAFDLFNCDSYNSTVVQYFPANNQWVVREATGSPGPGTNSQANGVLIPGTRQMWVLGNSDSAGRALRYNLSNLSSVTGTDYSATCAADPVCNTVISNTTGGHGQAPGLAYRATDHQIYSWNSGNGGTYYTLDPATLVGTVHALVGGPPTTGNGAGGTYGRFQYSPSLDAFVLIPGYNQSTAILSLNAADPSGSCSISPATLGPWTTGQSNPATLTAVGCNSSTWAVFSGSLPTGLSLNSATGAITGTISASGTFTPTVTYDTASQPYSIVVTAASAGGRVVSSGSLVSGGAILR